MFLLVTPKVGQVSWWFKAIGCQELVTREKLQNWYTRQKRGLVEGSNPLIASGVASKATAVLFGFIGIKDESKTLKWLSVGLGLSGLIESISGGAFVYGLLEDAKAKKVSVGEEEAPEVETTPPPAEKKDESVPLTTVTEVHHHYYFHSPNGEVIKIEQPSNIDENSKVISEIQKILTVCSQLPNENKKTLEALISAGTKDMSPEQLEICLKHKDKLVQSWALVCLLNKENTDVIEPMLLNMGNKIEYHYIWELARELLLPSENDKFVKLLVESTNNSKTLTSNITKLMTKFNNKPN